ncbi:type II toxin-antitoxin system RelE/ParE family toxin [Nocardia flavorosea]|nr:type II toxin-antitoxin system RelE/ParE family toxin [Nocardia flavorosea]
MPLSRSLGDEARELRIHLHPIDVRVTYWFAPGDHIVMLTAFRKTRDNERFEVLPAEEARRLCSESQISMRLSG